MRYLIRAPFSFDVGQTERDCIENKGLFDAVTLRQDYHGSAHADTQTIYLRMCKDISVESAFNDIDATDRSEYELFPEARMMVDQTLMSVRGTQLGRVMLVKLRAGGRVLPHKDEGAYADYYDRFHIPIVSADGNLFIVGDEKATLKQGEVWWFDKHVTHEAINNSDSDRIHLIFDIKLNR